VGAIWKNRFPQNFHGKISQENGKKWEKKLTEKFLKKNGKKWLRKSDAKTFKWRRRGVVVIVYAIKHKIVRSNLVSV
jgi:hypothetical protein